MDIHGLHPMTVQEAEQEMSHAADRIRAFNADHAGCYELRTVSQRVSGMQPTCLRCGAYVHDLAAHDEYHQSLITVVELLWGLYPGGPVVDLAYVPHQLGELVRRMIVRCQ